MRAEILHSADNLNISVTPFPSPLSPSLVSTLCRVRSGFCFWRWLCELHRLNQDKNVPLWAWCPRLNLNLSTSRICVFISGYAFFNMIIISYNAFNNLTIAIRRTDKWKERARDVFVWLTTDLMAGWTHCCVLCVCVCFFLCFLSFLLPVCRFSFWRVCIFRSTCESLQYYFIYVMKWSQPKSSQSIHFSLFYGLYFFFLPPTEDLL